MLLAEQLFLLSHYDEAKQTCHSHNLDYGSINITAALLAELFIGGHIEVMDAKVVTTGKSPAGDTLLSMLYEQIRQMPPGNTDNGNWFQYIYEYAYPYGELMYEKFMHDQVFRIVEQKRWGLWTKQLHVLTNPNLRQDLINRIHDMLMSRTQPEPILATAYFLTQATGFMDEPKYPRAERRQREKRWEALFADFYGAFPDQKIEPIPGLPQDIRYAIGELMVFIGETW